MKIEILRWAYNRAANKDSLHKKFAKLDEWLSGTSQPTFKQLENFAKSTSTPLGYFFLEGVPVQELPIPHYRTLEDGIQNEPSPDLIETLHIIQRRQDFVKDYFEKFVGESLSFVNSYNGQSPVELASKIYSLLELDFEWYRKTKNSHEAIRYLIGKCEEKRIIVMINGIVGNNTQRPLSVDEFRGFVLVDKVVPFIFINGADTKSAQLFTLVHELAHVFIGSSAVVEASPLKRDGSDVEKLCNAAAVELLCPRDAFAKEWEKHDGNVVYKSLGNVFKVSPIVIGRRAMDLDLISKDEFYSFYYQYLAEIKEFKKAGLSGGDFYQSSKIKLGELFSKIISLQVKSGNIQYTDAYKLTGLKGNTFQKYFDFLNEKGR